MIRRKPLDLRRLRAFLAVCETRHFGRAAALLGMAQPPLSQQIARLEAEIGAALFTRAKSGSERVKLTDAGDALAPLARKLLIDADTAGSAARAAAAGVRGTLRIAFVASLAGSPLPSLLRRYRELCPHVRLDLREMTTTPMLQALAAGEIELGLGREVGPAHGVDAVTLWREPLLAVVPVDHPLASTPPLDLRHLADESFVLPPRRAGTGFANQLARLFGVAGVAPAVAQEATEWSTIFALVAAGVGVTLAPASATALLPGGLVARPLDAAEATTVVSLCWSADRNSTVRNRFKDWLLSEAHVKAS